jgi:hypothetical protein
MPLGLLGWGSVGWKRLREFSALRRNDLLHRWAILALPVDDQLFYHLAGAPFDPSLRLTATTRFGQGLWFFPHIDCAGRGAFFRLDALPECIHNVDNVVWPRLWLLRGCWKPRFFCFQKIDYRIFITVF